MFGQHFKFDMDLLSYFPDAKLQRCSQMKLKLKTSVFRFAPRPSKSGHLDTNWTNVINFIARNGLIGF